MLSINRTVPNMHASETMQPSLPTFTKGCIVSKSSIATYWTSDIMGSVRRILSTTSCKSAASRSSIPLAKRDSNTSLAAHNALYTTGAIARCSAFKYAFRLDIANPSRSLMVSKIWTLIFIFISSTMRRMRTHWTASFCPKYAFVGCTILNSLVTTVATPRK